MKKIIAAMLVLSSTASFAQNRGDARQHTPPSVQQSFQREHPEGKNAHWEQTNNQWHASYQDKHNKRVDTYYDGNGHMRDTRRQIDRREVPSNVDAQVRRRYGNKNYQVTRIERPNSSPLFQISLGLGNTSFFLDAGGRQTTYPH